MKTACGAGTPARSAGNCAGVSLSTKSLRQACALALALTLPVSQAWAQQRALQQSIEPIRPTGTVIKRPYLPVEVPPIRLQNSERMKILIRAGKLYLSAHEAIALALENNIDIENARYSSVLLSWNLERAQAGGALPGVPSGASQSASIQNGQGVLGAQQAAGVQIAGSRGGSSGTTNATVAQVGPVTANLDPTIQESSTFSHRTSPQPNAVASVTAVLVQNARNSSVAYQQGFLTGGGVTVTYADHYLNENAATDVLNPSVAPTLSISIQHNLLQGFGVAVNKRSITVAKMNLDDSDLNFKTQVTRTVVNVLNTYYSLVADDDDLKAKQGALETAGRFLDESRKRLELGALAELDVTTAQNQEATSRQALIASQSTRRQQELQLKNLISRTGIGDPLLANIDIVPVDHLVIPASDDIPPLKDLVKQALANRSDLVVERGNLRQTEINNLGTRNGLLPTAQAFSTQTNAGLAGTPRLVTPRSGGPPYTADNYYAGGTGNALGQIFRRNFPTESLGVFMQAQVHDRQAQGDYGIDQLSFRQQQLTTAKDMNQAQVDVANSVVALRQARARYDAAVQSRILQEQLFDAEEKKFNLGASTPYNVVVEQRDLATAQASELSALASYQAARISLDQTIGATLEVNHVSLGEAQTGIVSQPSSLPANLP
ncbi:MAG TPA: TolC family protein [Bryobacteraceae bacterium]|nr:TolC family protein [Bryobacteraceae bacterium]